MSTQHIENLQISNFKCFERLEVAGLGQVNLIGGKNNIGKTAFLEAMELLLSSHSVSSLAFMVDCILKRRQDEKNDRKLDFFYKNQSVLKIFCDSKCCQIEWGVKQANDSNLELSRDELWLFFTKENPNYTAKEIVPTKDFSALDSSNPPYWMSDSKAFTYISSAKSKEQDIAILLGKLVDLDREDFLNESISLFDNNIVAIKQVATQYGVVLKLKSKDQDNLVLLSSLGEGINRYIAILCAIWANKDGFLLIDEIEIGIHYTNYEKLWEIIFKVSVEANCQLFATTHSKECILAFNKVQFKLAGCNAQYLELYKNLKTNRIVAQGRDKEQLRYELAHDGRVRGE